MGHGSCSRPESHTSRTRSQVGGSALFVVPALGGSPGGWLATFPGASRFRRAGPATGVESLSAVRMACTSMDAGNPKSTRLVAAGQEVTVAGLVAGWTTDRVRQPGDLLHVRRGEFGQRLDQHDFRGRRRRAGRTTRVTTGDWLDVNPLWMPDGRALLFISSRGGGRDVFRQRLDSNGQPEGEPDRMTSGLNAHGISLSFDGRLLAYSSYVQRANIWSVPLLTDRPASVRDALQVTSGAETDRETCHLLGRAMAGLRFGSKRPDGHLEDACSPAERRSR